MWKWEKSTMWKWEITMVNLDTWEKVSHISDEAFSSIVKAYSDILESITEGRLDELFPPAHFQLAYVVFHKES